jgi:phosphoribosyl 1,2-cyclic phosphate phosphodiesterase
MKGKLTFLGTGASTGVPVIDCYCDTCRSVNVKNKRLRSSAFLTLGNKTLLIDASPDLRQQALTFRISAPDAVFLTHTHYDHVGGLEELRVYNFQKKKPLTCFLSSESYENVKKMFYYHFVPRCPEGNFSAQFDFKVLTSHNGHFSYAGGDLRYFTYYQGKMPVLGLRIGELAYVTDIKEYNESIIQELYGVKTLVVSASGFERTRVQMTIDEALLFREKVAASCMFLTHLSHDVEYAKVSPLLPNGVFLAYDGFETDFHY